ncbi:MAG: SRPBCC domain-containing protein [Gemmatimonadetes bacterium]|nr:SRPBCC domain-containing protein [Gemmatimonadota bacterium]
MPAPATRIFAALTTQAELEQWFAEHARVEPKPGGAFRFWGRYTVGTPGEADATGTVTNIGPDARLAFRWQLFGVPTRGTITWPDWRGDASVPTQSVTWLLKTQGSGTVVTIVHAGFTRAVDISDFPFGWGHSMSETAKVAVNLEE